MIRKHAKAPSRKGLFCRQVKGVVKSLDVGCARYFGFREKLAVKLWCFLW